jgi:hypothetical protein
MPIPVSSLVNTSKASIKLPLQNIQCKRAFPPPNPPAKLHKQQTSLKPARIPDIAIHIIPCRPNVIQSVPSQTRKLLQLT